MNKIKYKYNVLVLVISILIAFILGGLLQVSVFAATINGPTVEGNQIGVASGNSMITQKRGTYIINLKSASAQYGGRGSDVDFKINLNVGDVIAVQTEAPTNPTKGKGYPGQTGAHGITLTLNGAFLVSLQGGSGDGGNGASDASGKPSYYKDGGHGGTGGVSEGGNCLSNSGSGGSGGTYSSQGGKPGSDGTGIWASSEILSHTSLGFNTSGTSCSILFKNAYSNTVTSWIINPSTYSAPFGYTAEQIIQDFLPKQIQMVTTLKTYTVDVTNWKCNYFKKGQGGDYYFEAIIIYPEDSSNPAGLKPQALVQIKAPGDSEYNYLGQIEIVGAIDRLNKTIADISLVGGEAGTQSAVASVIKGKAFNIYIPVESTKQGTEVIGTVTVINNDVTDGLLQITGKIDKEGNTEVVYSGTKFVLNTVIEPDSSNVGAVLN